MDPAPEDQSPKPVPVGRRTAPRPRLSLPAEPIAVERAHACILTNLTRTGAEVAILAAMRSIFDELLTDEQVLEIRRHSENFEEREQRALIETARTRVTVDSDDDRPT